MPRHKLLAALPDIYRATLPTTGRLRLTASWKNKELRITELRAQGTAITGLDWQEDEPAVALVLHALRIEPAAKPPVFREHHQTLAGLGLHALARHYQRAAMPGDESVIRDLAALATACPPALAKGGEFGIPVADDGVWVGAVADGCLLVRTFLGPRMQPR
jgi:hypothetical protein